MKATGQESFPVHGLEWLRLRRESLQVPNLLDDIACEEAEERSRRVGGAVGGSARRRCSGEEKSVRRL